MQEPKEKKKSNESSKERVPKNLTFLAPTTATPHPMREAGNETKGPGLLVEILVGSLLLAFLGLAPLSFVELTFRLRHFCLAAAVDERILSNKYANCHPHRNLVGLGPLIFLGINYYAIWQLPIGCKFRLLFVTLWLFFQIKFGLWCSLPLSLTQSIERVRVKCTWGP